MASARLYKTGVASPTNEKKWTLSAWFKFNKPAITPSIAYETTDSQSYYRIYDNATFRFYGEAGVDKSSYSEDPRGHNSSNQWQTSAGKALFYKVTYGQVIN